jgi:hypothetical protein
MSHEQYGQTDNLRTYLRTAVSARSGRARFAVRSGRQAAPEEVAQRANISPTCTRAEQGGARVTDVLNHIVGLMLTDVDANMSSCRLGVHRIRYKAPKCHAASATPARCARSRPDQDRDLESSPGIAPPPPS